MPRKGNASVGSESCSGGYPGDEAFAGDREETAPALAGTLLERVLAGSNLRRALRRVIRNQGAPGIDGMTVEELPGYLREHWQELRMALLEGRYQPQPVRRVMIPKSGGGERQIGVPTAVDRFIQQAVQQVLQAEWDGGFSTHSYGFRPGRSAHQAVRAAQAHVRAGYRVVVDLDLEKFFDRVSHDVLLTKVRARLSDQRVIGLIHRLLTAGAVMLSGSEPTHEGTPQGSPLSPLLSNLLLDDLDRELERRGHRFGRYADDCNIYVRSWAAGRRVMASVKRYLAQRLRLQVNASKSAVDWAWNRRFLGFTVTWDAGHRLKVSARALVALKERVRVITGRTRGRSIGAIVGTLRQYLIGWRAYFGVTEVPTPLRELDKWVRRRLRSYIWKQWGRAGYRRLRARGVGRQVAWNTAKSAHGPWRLSQSPALVMALPAQYFRALGLPELAGDR